MAPKDIIESIVKKTDPNQVLGELGEILEFAGHDLVSESRLLVHVEKFLNKIYRQIKKDGKYPKITDTQMKKLKEMQSEAKSLNFYLKQKKLKPKHFAMAQNLGEKMVKFAGKLKTIIIPIILLTQAIEKIT